MLNEEIEVIEVVIQCQGVIQVEVEIEVVELIEVRYLYDILEE